MGGTDELGDMANRHSDKVEQASDQGLDRAGDLADERTGGQHGDRVDKAQAKADEHLDGGDEAQSPT